MKKNIWVALGIAGILFGTPLAGTQEASAGVGVNIRLGGRRHHHHHNRHWHRRYRHSGVSATATDLKQV
ncbi:MAG: hypothetical protein NT163_02525 [Chlorobiales bacterium]|nr:hypothetical protein [Chlorobiales bacterium]